MRVNQSDMFSPESLSSVEVYVPSTRLSYSCPSLPEVRALHAQAGSHYCGGGGSESFLDSLNCYRFSGGVWQNSINLTQLTMMPTSFESSVGLVVLGAIDLTRETMQAVQMENVETPKPLFDLEVPAL